MIRVALFDVDGIIVLRERYFSERYAEEYGVPLELVREFFMGDFIESSFGRADLKEIIAPHLTRWGWNGSVDEYLSYWFGAESATDDRVLQVIDALRAKGVTCYIASRQEKYRMQYLLDDVGLRSHFDGWFVSAELGRDKWEPEFWEAVIASLGVLPEEILFFDDKQKNVDAARASGIQAHLYDDFAVLERETAAILPAS
jgi:putative hydrolase of the HAD superfamily